MIITTRTVSEAMGVDELWSEADGSGVTIAVIDSGVDDSTPGLRGKVVKHIDLVGEEEMHPHGTCVAGIAAGRPTIVGDREFAGIAPGASIVDIRVVDARGRASYFNVLRGLEIAIESPEIKVINMSLGTPVPCCCSTMSDLIDEAARRGKIVVVAAGNFGPRIGSVGCPGGLPNAVSVGCVCCTVDRNRVAWFSARGPGCGGVIKPDFVAYGGCGDITGEQQPVELIAVPFRDGAIAARGTSFSAPVVTGVTALIAERVPKLSIESLKEVAPQTCLDLGPHGKDNAYGWGLPEPQAMMTEVAKIPTPKISREIKRKSIGVAATMLIMGMLLIASRR